ncbi:hypothetical protein [Sutcliffiella rhizosphaerae]|uniref:ABC transporter permease n=1 Tax=Sutcliffiella rhizosphaerae TaxID=2880967 RepID=A0ABM8YKV7_9BACI|nr:hypothetical protein [Sutcliffiella rhizosphaerae]CAG9620594.1 hypothetical protein BACCIP111883_01363 [Sutcliffiella rhizosphaerae]
MSEAFWGLMKKEWLITKHIFFILLTAMICVWFTAVVWSVFQTNSDLAWIITAMLVSVHVIYLVMIFGSGLEMEAKTQLWLHNPLPARILLASKLATGFYMQLISGLLTMIMFAVTFLLGKAEIISYFEVPPKVIAISWVQIILLSLELAMYYLFYWTAYQAMYKNYYLKKMRVPLLIFLIVASQILFVFINKQIISGLETLVPLSIELPVAFSFNISGSGVGAIAQAETTSFLGIIFSIGKIVGFFYLSAWILHRVVEAK